MDKISIIEQIDQQIYINLSVKVCNEKKLKTERAARSRGSLVAEG